jgi:hypothetical protein
MMPDPQHDLAQAPHQGSRGWGFQIRHHRFILEISVDPMRHATIIIRRTRLRLTAF